MGSQGWEGCVVRKESDHHTLRPLLCVGTRGWSPGEVSLWRYSVAVLSDYTQLVTLHDVGGPHPNR